MLSDVEGAPAGLPPRASKAVAAIMDEQIVGLRRELRAVEALVQEADGHLGVREEGWRSVAMQRLEEALRRARGVQRALQRVA